jgi:hypothetical protein
MSSSNAERAAAALLRACWRRVVEVGVATNAALVCDKPGGAEALLAKVAPKKAVETF